MKEKKLQKIVKYEDDILTPPLFIGYNIVIGISAYFFALINIPMREIAYIGIPATIIAINMIIFLVMYLPYRRVYYTEIK